MKEIRWTYPHHKEPRNVTPLDRVYIRASDGALFVQEGLWKKRLRVPFIPERTAIEDQAPSVTRARALLAKAAAEDAQSSPESAATHRKPER